MADFYLRANKLRARVCRDCRRSFDPLFSGEKFCTDCKRHDFPPCALPGCHQAARTRFTNRRNFCCPEHSAAAARDALTGACMGCARPITSRGRSGLCQPCSLAEGRKLANTPEAKAKRRESFAELEIAIICPQCHKPGTRKILRGVYCSNRCAVKACREREKAKAFGTLLSAKASA